MSAPADLPAMPQFLPEASGTTTRIRSSFLDLPPETRNQIYRSLFKDANIKIRSGDRSSTGKLIISRDRAIGMNILFACKTTYAEARLLLIATTTFNINFTDMAFRQYGHDDDKQGFGCQELARVRHVELPEVPDCSLKGRQRQIAAMPVLYDITISETEAMHINISGLSPGSLDTSNDKIPWHKFASSIVFDWTWARYANLLEHIQAVAQQLNLRPTFNLKYKVYGKEVQSGRLRRHTRTQIDILTLYVDLIAETMKLMKTDSDGKNTRVWKQHLPGLVAMLKAHDAPSSGV